MKWRLQKPDSIDFLPNQMWNREMCPRTSNGGNGNWKLSVLKIQCAIILNCAGPHVLEVYDTFILTDDSDKDKPKRVLEALEVCCNPHDNEVIKSHRFCTISYQEPFGKFLTELKTIAAACSFPEKKRSYIERQNSFYCDWKTSRVTPQGRQFNTRQSN